MSSAFHLLCPRISQLCALTLKNLDKLISDTLKISIVQGCMGEKSFGLIRLYYLLKKKIQL